ncbi:MAG: AsmA family protein [Burkholderiales bacterium]|nr:MAG: AsmA family protein [Burkholderiales bacterium]
MSGAAAMIPSRRRTWVAAAVVALLLLGGALAFGALASGWMLERATEAVRDATGRELRVSGDVALQLFPPRLAARGVALSNAPGADRADMLVAQRIEAATTWGALLRGDWGLNLTLAEARLNLETDAQGRRNWHFERGARDAAPGSDQPGAERKQARLALPLGRLVLERGIVEYRDRATGRARAVAIDEASLEPADGNRTALRLRAEYAGRPFTLAALAGASLRELATGTHELPLEFEATLDGRALAGDMRLAFNGARRRAAGTLSSDRLVLHRALALTAVRASLALADGRLQLEPLEARFAGGTLSGAAVLELSPDAPPRAALALDGRGIEPGRLLEALGRPDLLSGGAAEGRLELRTAGRSPAEWLAGLDGHLRLVAGPAQMRGRALEQAGDLLAQLIAALEPGAQRSEFTRIRCAVVNAPIRRGIVQVQRNVAAETDRVGVTLVGSADLVRQRLDLVLRPSVLEGAGVGLGQLAGMLRLEGPFDAPTLAIDPRGAAGLALELGAGIASGGLSVLGKRLLEQATGATAPCRQALQAQHQ